MWVNKLSIDGSMNLLLWTRVLVLFSLVLLNASCLLNIFGRISPPVCLILPVGLTILGEFSPVLLIDTKVCSVKKDTTLWNGHFMSISGHFIANYINIFHITEVPTVILRCIKCLNLNWIKLYDINHKCFFFFFFFNFGRKKPENSSF